MRHGVKLFTGDLCDSVEHCFLELSQGEQNFSVQTRWTPKLGDRSSEKEVMETALVPGKQWSDRED